MRILVVSQHFWPESFRLNSFIDDLQAVGIEVEVLTGQPNYPAGQTFDGYRWWGVGTDTRRGYALHRVPLLPRGRGGAVGLIANYLSFIVSGVTFGSWLLRGRRADLIFVYATSPVLQALVAIWLKLLKRAKLVIWIQDLWPEVLAATGYVTNRRLLAVVAKIVAFIYRQADLLLVQSHAFEPAVRRHAGVVPIAYFPNPGDVHLAPEAAVPARELAAGEPFNIMFAGNLGMAQALDTVVEAAALLDPADNIRIVLVGSGARSEWLAAEVAERGLTNVELAGRFPPEEMPLVFARASALLLTLTKDPIVGLTIPSKVQSYLAAGLPIIAAADGAGAELVAASGAGLTCPAEDATALAGAMVAMRRKSSEERRRMGEAGQRYYREHFDPRSLARDICNRFVALVDGSNARGKLNGG